MLDNEKTVFLDEETALQLKAISAMFREENHREVSAQALVRDAVGRIHASLLKSHPSYAEFFRRVGDENNAADDDDSGNAAELLTEFPHDFQDLETGIESIFLRRKFRCPICGTAFTAPQLKTGSLVARFDNRTQLDVYTGVRQDSDKEFVDYSLFLIMVCPGCLYAAQEREFDVWDASGREPTWKKRQKTKLPSKVVKQFMVNIPKRYKIACQAACHGQNLFSTKRTENDAAVALDLATETLGYLISKVSPNRAAELIYQSGVMCLMKSLQYEKMLEDQENKPLFAEIRQKRQTSIRDALAFFNRVPDQSVENFEIRESIRFHARRFWAAQEMRDAKAFSLSGAALQRLNNQFVNMVKKVERDIAGEDAKIRKLNEEVRKAGNMQKKEAFQRQVKEADNNRNLLRTGLENARSVLRVITPIYDAVSIPYDKFKEIQRQKKAAQTQ